MSIKEELLRRNLVTDNLYLELYVDLVETNKDTKPRRYYTQRHHHQP